MHAILRTLLETVKNSPSEHAGEYLLEAQPVTRHSAASLRSLLFERSRALPYRLPLSPDTFHSPRDDARSELRPGCTPSTRCTVGTRSGTGNRPRLRLFFDTLVPGRRAHRRRRTPNPASDRDRTKQKKDFPLSDRYKNKGEATRYASSETRDTSVSVHGERGTTTARQKQRPKTAPCRNVVSAIRFNPVLSADSYSPDRPTANDFRNDRIRIRRHAQKNPTFRRPSVSGPDTPTSGNDEDADRNAPEGLREAPPNFVRPAAPSTVYRKT